MLLAGKTSDTGCAGVAITPVRHDEESTDETLVAAVRQGDDRAFERLYERYQRRIAAHVFGMVHDHGRAEDVTQEVFISALRRMRGTDRPIAFRPWIYEIAKNACIDQYRRSQRAEEVSFDVADDAGTLEAGRLTAAAPTPDAAVDAKQQLDDLCGAFGGLSDVHHQVLVLRELEGLSYQQIGDRLGLSRPAVESTLFRARRKLTEEYGELVSGARCVAIQHLLAGDVSGIGRRENRRLARHIAHCQPCRRQAHAAGLDTTTLLQAVRKLSVRRVAALLPFPGLLRFRRGGSLDQLAGSIAPSAEPASGWGKAVAAAAAVLVAGGAGVASHDEPSSPLPVARSAAETAGHAAHRRGAISAAAAASGGRSRTAGAPAASNAQTARTERIAGRTVVLKSPAASGHGNGAPTRTTNPAAAPSPTGTATVPPAAGDPSATAGSGGGSSSSSSGGGKAKGPVSKVVEKVLPPGSGSGSSGSGGGSVTGTVQQAAGAVDETTGAAVQGVQNTVGQVGSALQQPAQTVQQPVQTVQNVVTGATDTVGDVLNGAGGLLGG